MDYLFEGINQLLSAVRSMLQYHKIEESLEVDYEQPSRNDALGESLERVFSYDILRNITAANLIVVL